MLDTYNPPWMTEDLDIFKDAVNKFYTREFAPHSEKWTKQGMVDRDAWNKAGAAGLLCASIPEEFGGAGGDYRHEAILAEEMERTGVVGFGNTVHSLICAHYLNAYGTDEQKAHILPKMASGEMVCAIAMTEPGTGSDLQSVKTTALKEGNQYVINGSKTFISNGQHADLVIVVAKPTQAKALKVFRSCLSKPMAPKVLPVAVISTKWANMPPTHLNCFLTMSKCQRPAFWVVRKAAAFIS